MSNGKAIETAYNGHLFRSRLEARWAVFLKALGVRYEYEKEGYSLDSGAYLPDFWLPIQYLKCRPPPYDKCSGFWLEIKPDTPSETEENLLMELCLETGHNGFFFYGSIGEQKVYKVMVIRSVGRMKRVATLPTTRRIITTGDSPSNGVLCALVQYDPFTSDLFMCSQRETAFTDRLTPWNAAILAGRSARFEHGQKGRML